MIIDEISFPSDQHFGERMSERIGGMSLSGFDPSNFWSNETMPEKSEIKKNIIKETLSVLNKRVNALKSESFDDSLKIYYMVLKIKVLKDGKLFSPIFTGSVEKEDGSTQQTHGNTFVVPVANNVARTIYIVGDDISGAEIASKNRLKYPGYKVEYREYHKHGENFEYIINYKNIISGPATAESNTSELSQNLKNALKTLNKIDVQALDPSEVKKTYVYYNNAFASFKKQFNDVEERLFNAKMDEFVNRLNNIEKQIANPNSISANELKVGRFTELGGKGRVKIMDYDYYFAPDGKGKPSNDKLKVQVLMPSGAKTFLLTVFGDENDMKKLRTRIKKEKMIAEIRKVIREIILENKKI
jgi:hypothetical protein